MSDQTKKKNKQKLNHPVKRVLKSVGWAFLTVIILIIVAVLMMLIGKSDVTVKIDDFLGNIWLPFTFIRLALYILAAYIFFPFIIKNLRIKNQEALTQIKANMKRATEEEQAEYIEWENFLNAKHKAYQNYLSNRHWILVVLVVIDIIFIQIPYFLRG